MFRYLKILLYKEIKQTLEDRSVFVLVFVLPLILVIIYGSAIRMEVKPLTIAVVSTQSSTLERECVSEFLGSVYFDTTVVSSLKEAQDLFYHNKVKALVYFPKNLVSDIQNGHGEIMAYLNAVEAQMSTTAKTYIEQVIFAASAKVLSIPENEGLNLVTRNWFNEENESVWFIMPGQYVSIITLMAIFLGSFVIAREYDRNTIEALSATNASALEIVLSKVIVNYVLALMALFVILLFGELLYAIPIRGSVLLILLSLSEYALEMVCLGVLLSALLKNQFLAVQIAVVIGFLPAVMLSGLIFDLRAVEWFIKIIGNLIPATYEITAIRYCFLSGGGTQYILFNLLLQAIFTIVFFSLTVLIVKKSCK